MQIKTNNLLEIEDKNISHFIFDFDGTLTDSRKLVADIAKETLTEFGVSLPPEEESNTTKKLWVWEQQNNTTHYSIKLIYQMFYFTAKIHKLSKIKCFIFSLICARKVLYRYSKVPLRLEVPDILKKLQMKNITMSIVSSAKLSLIENTLNRQNCLHYFDLIISKDDVSVSKPSPEGINKALSEININRQNVIYIGDLITDVIAANNAGVKSIALINNFTPTDEFKKENATYLFYNLNEIISIID